MSETKSLDRIGVGIDTARYGHRVSFLRPDRLPAAKPITVLENRTGYRGLQERLEQLQRQHPQAHFHVRIDAAGQYAANLEHFLRGLDLPMTLSIGEPKRNKDYQKAHFPKRTTDDTESQAMARFAVVEQPSATAATTPAMVLLREVAGRLQTKVKQSTQAINRLHNLLARVFPELATLTEDIAAAWVLRLLDKYPSAERIAQARLQNLEKIPYVSPELAQQVQLAAQQSVASLRGDVAETLLRDLVAQVRDCERAEQNMRQLLKQAFAELPPSGHLQVETIIGIGTATAAVLVAKIVDIDRFATAADLVGYFGVFPDEESSGVDKHGNPLPLGTLRMSRKGNDLVRNYLWNAARSAMTHNPAVRALYRRLKARGKRGDVAIGHCMQKLLHLVFAVWKTNRPFDPKHFPWEQSSDIHMSSETPAGLDATANSAGVAGSDKAVGHKRDEPAQEVVTTAAPTVVPAPLPVKRVPPTTSTRPKRVKREQSSDIHMSSETPAGLDATANSAAVAAVASVASVAGSDKAVGHKRDEPAQEVVTTAAPTVAPAPPPVKRVPPTTSTRPKRVKIDFAFLRQQVTMKQVLEHLGLLDGLRGRGQQRRGPCPIHSQPTDPQRTFSANLSKHVFQCFHADCGAHGNVLDFWAAVHHLPLYEAALQLADIFHLRRNREEEPVQRTRERGQTTANSDTKRE